MSSKCRGGCISWAFDIDSSAMADHHVLDDRQAEARAALLARPGLVDPVEALENAAEIGFGPQWSHFLQLCRDAIPAGRLVTSEDVGNSTVPKPTR